MHQITIKYHQQRLKRRILQDYIINRQESPPLLMLLTILGSLYWSISIEYNYVSSHYVDVIPYWFWFLFTGYQLGSWCHLSVPSEVSRHFSWCRVAFNLLLSAFTVSICGQPLNLPQEHSLFMWYTHTRRRQDRAKKLSSILTYFAQAILQ